MEGFRRLFEKRQLGTQHDWRSYAEQTKENPPSMLLRTALELVHERDEALDLGAGALRDSKYMLQEGFNKVTAVDVEESIKRRGDEVGDRRLAIVVSSFETYDFPNSNFDIVNAQNSLPFIRPESFNTVFNKVKSSLKSKGILTGTLFGVHDEWRSQRDMTFHTLEQVQELLSDMEIIDLKQIEKQGPTAAGPMKHWHIFQITARK